MCLGLLFKIKFMEKEIWLPIVKPMDLVGKYEISSMGRLKRCGYLMKSKKWKPELILSLSVKTKYLKFAFKYNKKNYNISIHRLVCLAFHENNCNKPQVNHKNGIKHDNRAVNLEWCDQSENIRHAQSIGLIKKAVIKQKVPRKIREKGLNTKKIIDTSNGVIYDSIDILCKEKGLSSNNIQRQISGARWCYVPYRYIGQEDKVKIPPPPIPKVEKIKEIKVRPPKKVYIPHPLERKKMAMYDVSGNLVKLFDSSTEAAEHVKSNPDTFRRAVRRSPRSFTKGYVFKYL